MKKKLLVIIENLEVGGAQNMVLELVKNIDKDKFSVNVLCYGRKRNSIVEEKIESICSVLYMNISGHIKITDMVKVLKKMSELKPDIVHAHLGGVTFALPYALLHRKPAVITAHTKPEKAFSRLNEKILRVALKTNFVKLVAVSEENYVACKKYFGISDDKCFCINNGIDEKRFYREKHEGFTFINVARQDKNKNQQLLIKCFKKLHNEYPDTRLILAGDGPCHKELKELAKELELTDFVEFPGVVPDAENYLAKSDVFVLSSFREAMPLSVLEAMAAGLPIISTDVGGLKDVVKENGILVEAGNDEALYQSMHIMLNISKTEYEEMTVHSKEMVKDFSSVRMAEQYERIYNRL